MTEDEPVPISCCALLRSKSMYFTPGERPGRLCHRDDQTYWCSLTQSPEGPDQAPTDPPHCQPGRPCFRAEE